MATLGVLAAVIGTMVPSFSPILSLGAVAGLVVFIGTFASTRFALFVLIFATLLSPEFGSRTTGGGGVTLRLDDFLLLIIAFSQLAKAAVNRDIGIFIWTPLNRYITYYILVCVFPTGIGMISGRVQLLSGLFFVLKYFQYYIVYFMMINNITSRDHAKQFLVAIFLTATIVSFVAIAQIPGGGRVVAPFEGESGEPNTLGGYLLLMMSLAGGLLVVKDAVTKLTHKAALVGFFGLTGLPMLFTLSRATWLAAIPVLLLIWGFSPKKGVLTLLLIAGLLVAPNFMPESVEERLLYTVEKQTNKWARRQQVTYLGITFDTSSSARINSWAYALDEFTKHPLVGYGVTGWRFIDAQYLRILVETGLLGLSTFLLLQWRVLRESWRAYREVSDPLFQGVAAGFIIGTGGMLAHATMTNTFIIVRIMEPYWLIAAIVMASMDVSAQETDQIEPVEVAVGA